MTWEFFVGQVETKLKLFSKIEIIFLILIAFRLIANIQDDLAVL